MPTTQEELVEFLHHGNTQIRQIAAKNLVPYSEIEPSIFKTDGLLPVKDLKLLIKDYAPIAKNALTILINISSDRDVLKNVVDDNVFLESLLLRITNAKEPNANEMAMLLANMAKSDSIERIFTLKRDLPLGLSKSKVVIDQLMDCFVKGAEGSYNQKADFDYLAYLFADLAKFPIGQIYLTTPQPYDTHHPISKLLPFTTSPSHIRRLGVSSALKNASFHIPSHPILLSPTINMLPYILLPLSGPDPFTLEENEELLDELQFLGEDKVREKDTGVLKTFLETLLLLTTTREGREDLRKAGTYLIIRECHLAVENDEVREACERLVQVLMRDEEGDDKGTTAGTMKALGPATGNGTGGGEPPGRMVTTMDEEEDEDEDEDEKVVEIF